MMAVSATLQDGLLQIAANADNDLVVLTAYPAAYAVQGTGMAPVSFAKGSVGSIRIADVGGGGTGGKSGQSLLIGRAGGAVIGHGLAVEGIESTRLNASIATAKAAAVTFQGPVVLPAGGAVSISLAPSSEISFASTVDGASRLELSAPSGLVSLSGRVGGTTPLTALSFTRAGIVTASAAIAVDGQGRATTGITIGRDVGAVLIDGVGSSVRRYAGSGIRIAASVQNEGWSRTLSGFDVRQCGVGIGFAYDFDQSSAKAGFHAWNVSGNTVVGNATHGLRFGADLAGNSSTSGLVVTGNSITGNGGDGIRVDGTPRGLAIRGNTLLDNGKTSREAGIRLTDGRGLLRNSVLLEANVVGGSDAKKVGAATGIVARNMPGLRVLGNTVSNLSQGMSFTGDFTRQDGAPVLSGNVVGDVGTGISLAAATAMVADSTNAISGAKIGIRASGLCTGSAVEGVMISGSQSTAPDGRTGILLDGARSIAMTGVSITGGYFGVLAKGVATDSKLTNLKVMGSVVGVFLDGSSVASNATAGVKGLLIAGNTEISQSTSTGLHAQGDCSGTRVYGKGISGGSQGVHLLTTTGGRFEIPVSKCDVGFRVEGACTGTILQNTWASGCQTGVSLEGAKGALVKSVLLSANGLGIFAMGASSGTRIEACTAKTSLGDGVFLDEVTGLVLEGVTIADNGHRGLRVEGGGAGTKIGATTASGNSDRGISLSGVKGLVVNGGTRSIGNGGDGLSAEGDCAGTTITGVTLEGNEQNGLVLGAATGIALSGCTVKDNAGHGIRASGVCTGTVVSGSAVSGNALTGLVLSGARGLTVSGGNSITGNGGNGLTAESLCSGTKVYGNTISTNANAGLFLAAAKGVSVSNNTVSANTNYGLHATGLSTGTSVIGNTISGSKTKILVTATGGTFQKT